MKPEQSEQASRARMLAFIATARAILPTNPQLGLSSIAKLARCDHGIGAQLVELQVLKREEDGSVRFISTKTDDEIADLIVLARRKESASRDPLVSLRSQLDNDLREIRERVARVEETMAAPPTAPAVAKLGDEDLQLLNLAVADNKALVARVDELERVVGNLLRIEAGRSTDSPPRGVVTSHRPDFNVCVFGVYPRDQRPIRDHVTLANIGRNINLAFISPDERAMPSKLVDVVVCTDEGKRRAAEILKTFTRPVVHAPGGIKSISGKIVDLAKGVSP